MAADVHAEDLGRAGFCLPGRVRELDSSRLPAATDQHLRLDDDGRAELFRGSTGLDGIQGKTAVGDRNPEPPEESPCPDARAGPKRARVYRLHRDRPRVLCEHLSAVSRASIIVLIALGATFAGFVLATNAKRLGSDESETVPSVAASPQSARLDWRDDAATRASRSSSP